MKQIEVTSDKVKMTEIGRQLYKRRRLFTKVQAESIRKTISHFMPTSTEDEIDNFFFRYYYDYMVYGFNIDQLFYLHLIDKTHEEKIHILLMLQNFCIILVSTEDHQCICWRINMKPTTC